MTIARNEQPPKGHSGPFQFGLIHLFIAVAASAGVLTVLAALFHAARETEVHDACESNLRQIALAIQNYHDVFDCFPAASVTDATGQPAHSWRVAIVPFLEKIPPLAGYRYAEGWDGPNNSKLARHMPRSYLCPADKAGSRTTTSYVAVVGPETIWPGADRWVRMADVADGASKTILIVEIANSDIHWMEPRDLPVAELGKWLDPSHKPSLLNSHRQNGVTGGIVVFADGHTELLPPETTEERLRELLSRAEKLPAVGEY